MLKTQAWLWLRILAAAVFIMLMSGELLNAAAMKPILLKEHAYEHLCNSSTLVPKNVTNSSVIHAKCVEQDVAVNQIFLVLFFGINICGFFMGLLTDIVNTRVLLLVSSLGWAGGMIMLGFCSSPSFEAYIPAGLIIIFFGGVFYFAVLRLQMYSTHGAIVNSILTSMWDMSTFGAFVWYALSFYANISFKWICIAFAFVVIPSAVFSLFSFPFACEFQDKSKPVAQVEQTATRSKLVSKIKLLYELGKIDIPISVTSITIVLLHLNFFLATVRDQAFDIAQSNHEAGETLSMAFSIMLPVIGGLGGIFFGFLLNRFKIAAIVVHNILNVTWVVCCMIPVWQLQFVTYFAYCIWRICCFVIWGDFVLNRFQETGMQMTIYTSIFSFAGTIDTVCSLVLVRLVAYQFGGHFLYANLGMGIANIVASICFAALVIARERQKNSTEKYQQLN